MSLVYIGQRQRIRGVKQKYSIFYYSLKSIVAFSYYKHSIIINTTVTHEVIF